MITSVHLVESQRRYGNQKPGEKGMRTTVRRGSAGCAGNDCATRIGPGETGDRRSPRPDINGKVELTIVRRRPAVCR